MKKHSVRIFPYLLICVGVMFLLDNLGVIGSAWSWWPLLLVVAGAVMVYNGLKAPS